MNRARLLADRLAKLKKTRQPSCIPLMVFLIDADGLSVRFNGYPYTPQREGESVDDCIERVMNEHCEAYGVKEGDPVQPLSLQVQFIGHDTHP